MVEKLKHRIKNPEVIPAASGDLQRQENVNRLPEICFQQNIYEPGKDDVIYTCSRQQHLSSACNRSALRLLSCCIHLPEIDQWSTLEVSIRGG
jgi:hypothetical protein